MDRDGTLVFSPKDEPLREDVRVLGNLLGEVLQEQGGAELFERVETARQTAITRRNGDFLAEAKLTSFLGELNEEASINVVRAFSAYFSLVNLAERIHRLRRRREYDKEHKSQPGSMPAVIAAIKEAGVDLPTLQKMLSRIEINPVFTAHPTEAVRRSLLFKEQRIARSLVDRIEAGRLTHQEELAALGQIKDEVSLSWQTEEHLSQSPVVADEVEHVLFYLSEVIYRVLPVFYEELSDTIEKIYGTKITLSSQMIHFGSWVGGDMDGNPNVGPQTILATLARQRQVFVKKYQAEVRSLFDRLSQSQSRVGASEVLLQKLSQYQARFAKIVIPKRYDEMPYRRFLWFVSSRLEATERHEPDGYQGPDELHADLLLLEESLLQNKGSYAGCFRVTRVRRRLEAFGFYGASLDVRQDTLVHRRCVGLLLGDNDYSSRTSQERQSLLEVGLSSLKNGATPLALLVGAQFLSPGGEGTELQKTLSVFAAIKTAQSQFGASSIGPYIISMAQGADDVLSVLFLARCAGLVVDGQVPLNISPLFETVDDLTRAPTVLRALLEHPLYREHLRSRGDQQMIMLGYSDSNKESGIAASRVALYQAQRALSQISREHQVSLTLFHGRGGTASRGGSKPRAAILAEPPEALNGKLRVTEQGEIIHAKYGLRGIANRTLELMAGALLETVAKPPSEPSDEWRAALDNIAAQSRSTYRALVYEEPLFVEYFQGATPIDVIQRLRIGSRPAARRSGQGLGNLRAIPWVFAWTQSRHILPGWYGVGTGLEKAISELGLPFLRSLRGWAFFANLLSDVEMVLAKADLDIAARYAELSAEAGVVIFPKIKEEFFKTVRCINEISEQDTLLTRDPTLQRSIRLRNPYVDPMSLLQVSLLKRWRESDRQDTALERALLSTVQGIARGLQNTG